MLRDAGLDGFFSNHSLRRTCATRLFQAGQDVKIVKEITGHISDAVHKYQCTSTSQKMKVSEIIQGDVKEIKLSQSEPMEIVESPKLPSLEEKCKLPKLVLPIKVNEQVESEECNKYDLETDVGNIINSTVKAIGKRKAKVTIQVEFNE